MITQSFELTKFGELCRNGRARMHMTRPEMARKLMVSVKYVSDVEAGKRRPSEEYICKITGLLGLSSQEVKSAIKTDELFGLPSTENVIPFRML
ncbi:XRE family transcriptional regulator [Agrobacterium tumefaciens]|uniref:helix-turn-helix domain-containing protein n=1 Tax=Agrobacterium tumefaciens TaxID=358 RepID=UPI00122FE050|nr:XRE family transcriptional regulator [Agrobacterium tumefaciens]